MAGFFRKTGIKLLGLYLGDTSGWQRALARLGDLHQARNALDEFVRKRNADLESAKKAINPAKELLGN